MPSWRSGWNQGKGMEKYKMSLENFVIPEHKEMVKGRGKSGKISKGQESWPERSQWPKLEQTEQKFK